MQLRGVTYDWKTSGQHDIGFIAQEVETVLPEIVKTGDDGYKSVDYARVTSVLVEAVKTQQQQLDDYRIKVNALMESQSSQQAQIDALTAMVKSMAETTASR